MSILFVLLTFLLIVIVTYFVKGRDEVSAPPELALAPPPEIERPCGFEVPKTYCFHPGHTWVLDEGRQNARVGIDSFGAHLFGNIDRLEVIGLNRWVRQGQKLMTVTQGELSVDLLSPIEGIVMAVNAQVLKDPGLMKKEPYRSGWIAVIKSPDIATNLRNLVQGPLVAPWMQNTFGRLSTMTAQLTTATAADGGLPITGLLAHLEPGLQRRIIHEFFLT